MDELTEAEAAAEFARQKVLELQIQLNRTKRELESAMRRSSIAQAKVTMLQEEQRRHAIDRVA